ncbi:MAG: cupin domain-containing protein [Gammaproteobacteria bacterium]
MNVIRNRDLPRVTMDGMENVTLAGSHDGLKALSVWRQRMAPGSATPPHRHDCEEVVLILSGSGRLELEGAVQSFGPDTTLIVPRNAPHQIFNTGEEPMELIGIFAVAPVPVQLPDGTPIELPWPS